jgi:hypothetical protein
VIPENVKYNTSPGTMNPGPKSTTKVVGPLHDEIVYVVMELKSVAVGVGVGVGIIDVPVGVGVGVTISDVSVGVGVTGWSYDVQNPLLFNHIFASLAFANV